MNKWTPAEQTDIRATILRHVPKDQKSHPVFKRMAEQQKAGTHMPTLKMVWIQRTPEKMQ